MPELQSEKAAIVNRTTAIRPFKLRNPLLKAGFADLLFDLLDVMGYRFATFFGNA